MISVRTSTGIGLLAAGVGVGLGSTPAIASADGLDFQVSIDGYDLFPTAGNSATATSGMGDIAIAIGHGATATVPNGLGNFAFADGINAAALAGGGDYNTAIDIGNNTTGLIPVGDDSSIGPIALAGAGDYDSAWIIGNNSEANAGGNFLQVGADGNHDTAFVFNPFGTGGDVVGAGFNGVHTGNSDLGGILFLDNVVNTQATGGDNLYYIVSPSNVETNIPAEAVEPAATNPLAYSSIGAALSEDYAAGQAGFAAAATDFGNGHIGDGVANLFQGIDAYSLIAPENVLLGTVETLTNQPLILFYPPDFGVPATLAEGVAFTQQVIDTGENLFTEASASFAGGDYAQALSDTLQGADFTTVIPLELAILNVFATS